MLEPFLLPLLAKIRRELSRLIFIGLLFAYGLSALTVCGAGGCNAGAIPALTAIMGETRPYLWQGIALSFIVEFAGGIVSMTIGLALDWLKERRERRNAELYAEEQAGVVAEVRLVKAEARAEKAEALAALRAENAEALVASRIELAEARQRNLELENRMLRAGIDPDTGLPLPHFANGNANASATH